MKNIGIVILALAAVFAVSCKAKTKTYDGPNVVYFDQSDEGSNELAESNKVLSFRLTSPLAVSYDREYTISRTFGSTLEEGVNFQILSKKVVIKANQYWADGDVEFMPETLSPNVDTLALRVTPSAGAGEVASFDNVYKMLVSKRCDVNIQDYVGRYKHVTWFPGNMGMETEREVTLAYDANGNVIDNTLTVVDFYGSVNDGGGPIKIMLDMSNPAKGVTPVVELQRARNIMITMPDGKPGETPAYVCTTEQISYPKLPQSPNTSTLKTCSKEFNIMLTWGVFVELEDGTERSSHIEGTPSLEQLTYIPDSKSASVVSGGDNIEARSLICSEVY